MKPEHVLVLMVYDPGPDFRVGPNFQPVMGPPRYSCARYRELVCSLVHAIPADKNFN